MVTNKRLCTHVLATKQKQLQQDSTDTIHMHYLLYIVMPLQMFYAYSRVSLNDGTRNFKNSLGVDAIAAPLIDTNVSPSKTSEYLFFKTFMETCPQTPLVVGSTPRIFPPTQNTVWSPHGGFSLGRLKCMWCIDHPTDSHRPPMSHHPVSHAILLCTSLRLEYSYMCVFVICRHLLWWGWIRGICSPV